MKQILLIVLCLIVVSSARSQGITLLYKGGGSGGWNDPLSWIQINTPVGQTPIQRVPTELDDVVFSSSQSGLTSVNINFENPSDSINIGGGTSIGYRCRSMHVSNTELSLFETDLISALRLNVYTTNGGFVLIDSGSNFRYGHFSLHGGNPEVNDMEIVNSTFGSLFSHDDWSTILLEPNGKARFIGSTLGGHFFGSASTGGELYADSCTFRTTNFTLGDNSSATLLNCPIENDGNNSYMTFHIGRNANFVSSNTNITSYITLDFYTSGSVLNGNVTTLYPGSRFNFTQEDPANPLPNIINGNLTVVEDPSVGISGDVKISGNFENNCSPLAMYPDTSHLFINGQHIFEVGGIINYGNNLSITNCVGDYCHFNLEFFGNTNSNIFWPMGLPVDTLVINKSNCAKVTATNSIYVSGAAKIRSGQLVLDANDTIPYKFVCAGDLYIYEGGGVFLRRDSNGVVANMAVAGSLHDDNTAADSLCSGLSNPYSGNITLYGNGQGNGNNVIDVNSSSTIGNFSLIGESSANFMLGGNLTVNNFSFTNPTKLLLGNYNLIVNGNVSNYGSNNYFVTDGLGKLQINNVGNIETVFPVGTSSSSYNPATLKNAGTSDNFSVNVQPHVLSGGITGNTYTGGVVNRTWNISESVSGASDVTLTVQWNAEDELTDFTRNTSYLSHYTSGAWNNGTQMASCGSNPYSLTRNNITGFSPFAVMGTTTILPVVLRDFYGKYKDKSIALNWSTESELNIKYFTVEKSFDQVLFKPLINFSALVNSTGRNSYHHVDDGVFEEINYYRLKIVDLEGKYSYSKTIAVSAPMNNLVSIFPNPVTDELFIRLKKLSTETKISILDIKGSCIKKLILKAGLSATSVNMTDLPGGSYSIIISSEKWKKTLHFVKQ